MARRCGGACTPGPGRERCGRCCSRDRDASTRCSSNRGRPRSSRPTASCSCTTARTIRARAIPRFPPFAYQPGQVLFDRVRSVRMHRRGCTPSWQSTRTERRRAGRQRVLRRRRSCNSTDCGCCTSAWPTRASARRRRRWPERTEPRVRGARCRPARCHGYVPAQSVEEEYVAMKQPIAKLGRIGVVVGLLFTAACIQGPVTGGNGIALQTGFDLAQVGYQRSEFFVGGVARSYTPVASAHEQREVDASPRTRPEATECSRPASSSIDRPTRRGSTARSWSSGSTSAPVATSRPTGSWRTTSSSAAARCGSGSRRRPSASTTSRRMTARDTAHWCTRATVTPTTCSASRDETFARTSRPSSAGFSPIG